MRLLWKESCFREFLKLFKKVNEHVDVDDLSDNNSVSPSALRKLKTHRKGETRKKNHSFDNSASLVTCMLMTSLLIFRLSLDGRSRSFICL